MKGTVRDGYLRYSISINGKCLELSGHRMVATKFIQNPHDFPQVNHKDFNRGNNAVENLEWVSPQQNSFHSHHGTHQHINELISKAKKMRSEGIGQIEVAKSLGLSQGTVNTWAKGAGESKPRYGKEIKLQAIAMSRQGAGIGQIAKRLNISYSSAIRWIKGQHLGELNAQ